MTVPVNRGNPLHVLAAEELLCKRCGRLATEHDNSTTG